MEDEKPIAYREGEDRSSRGGAVSTNNEARILDAAELVFAKYGFRGATTAMIAAKAGVTKPNIYYYFRSKEALYRKILQDIQSIWAKSMSVLSEDAEPDVVIRHYVRKKLDFSRSHPNLSRIFANEVISGAPYIREEIKKSTRPLLLAKADVVEKWIKDGKIRSISPVHLIFMIWATTQAYADFAAQMQILLGKRQLDGADFTAAAETITAVILDGIRPPEKI